MVKPVKSGLLRDVLTLRKRVAALEAEVRELSAEVQEGRQLNLRLAEICDVTMELLVPVADRDEAAVAAVLDRYRSSIGDPLA